MTEARLGCPDLGVGVGLRVPHYRHILDHRPAVDFFEIISENFMVDGGKPIYHLERVLETYRVIQHGVSLGIGGPEEPDTAYLERLKRLVDKVQPAWLSDHFCWCSADGVNLHDLLPLPYTEEAIEIVVERAKKIQDFLGVRFALENTSTYLNYTSSEMPEWEFIGRIAEQADIGLMFDVNNIYVSAYNHGFDPLEFVRNVPHERIVQIHLAGHMNVGTHIIDTHSGHVIDPVYDIYRETIAQAGAVPTLIEWDDDIPEFSLLVAEAEKARDIRSDALELKARRAAGKASATPDWPWARAIEERGPADAQLEGETHAGTVQGGWKQGGPRESESTAAE